jgi:hypothetical protein
MTGRASEMICFSSSTVLHSATLLDIRGFALHYIKMIFATIRERLINLFNADGMTSKDTEKLTGIDLDKWNSVRARRRRVNEDDIEAFNEVFPQFAYWLTTGKTIPEAGQVKPEAKDSGRDVPEE